MKTNGGLEGYSTDIKKHMEKIILLSEADIKHKIDSGNRMIDYYSKLTSDVETRRIKIADNNFMRISVYIAALGVIVNLKLPLFQTLLFAITIFALIAPSIAVLIEYNKQCKFKYPWNRDSEGITNQWNWFYYGNPSLSKMNFETDKKIIDEQWVNYKDGLAFFLDRTFELTPTKTLESILYQQYLLQAHNAFKNKFYLKLVNIESQGFKIALWVIGLDLLIFAILRIIALIK